jgi:glutamyl-tRNA synthetase
VSAAAPGHRGRFAPSPTGRLHLGNARSALLGWLWARHAGGTFLLRIEDLDPQRCCASHLDDLLRDLEYLGITWDEAPLHQSARGALYDEALATLRAQGRVYPCYCSRAEVARAATAPHGPGDDGPRYPGTCALLSEDARAQKASTRPCALRFSARAGPTRFCDRVHGAVSSDVAAEVGDFVVRRADGVASYQLAVVVDDARSGVTHVLRGDDLLGSTPRQLQLYEALGSAPPAFAHVPLVLGEDGRRLAKREGAFAVTELRQAGIPPERVVGLLGHWSGLCAGPARADELIMDFDLHRVPRAPVHTSEAAIRFALGI